MIGILVENIKLNGGVEVVSKRLLDGFKSVKIPCQGFTFGLGDSKWIGLGDKNLFSRENIFDVIETLKEYNIENLIIQLNGPYCKLASIKFYKLLYKSGIKSFVVIHNSPKSFITRYFDDNDTRVIQALKWLRTKIILNKKYKRFFQQIKMFVTFVSISEGNRNELLKYFGLPSSVIPNFFDFIMMDVPLFGDKKKELLYIGRIDFYQKNIQLLLDAWKNVKDKKDWILKIIGSGSIDQENRMRDYIAKEDIKNVILLGHKDNKSVFEYLNKSSIVMLTSRFEGFPTVILEGAYEGNAFITTNFDGISYELLKDGENCYICTADNISESIEKLINSPTLLDAFRKKSVDLFEAYKAANDIIKKWIELLKM